MIVVSTSDKRQMNKRTIPIIIIVKSWSSIKIVNLRVVVTNLVQMHFSMQNRHLELSEIVFTSKIELHGQTYHTRMLGTYTVCPSFVDTYLVYSLITSTRKRIGN